MGGQELESIRQAVVNRKNLIGCRISPGERDCQVVAALGRQMSLPEGNSLNDVKDRIAGREKDFLLILRGIGELGIWDKARLRLLGAYLGVSKVEEK